MHHSKLEYLHIEEPFPLERGGILPSLSLAYTRYGALNAQRNNVVWICHAFTANADPMSWWPGLVGPGALLDPAKYHLVCANVLGSCYGSTGPRSYNPATGQSYGADWPLITIRDMARAHALLRHHLHLEHIGLCIGGSMGGQQVLEWALLEPERFDRLALLATNARHSAWGIAYNEAQRMALLADPTLYDTHDPQAGRQGLEAARAVAMLSYRHYQAYAATQTDPDEAKITDLQAASYQRYQGHKLWRRFDPLSYLSLSRSMDTHHLGRGRGGVATALAKIKQPTLVIGIDSDQLFPLEEQKLLALGLPYSQLEVLSSRAGHDGFLVETKPIAQRLQAFLCSDEMTASRGALPTSTKLAGNHLALPGTEAF